MKNQPPVLLTSIHLNLALKFVFRANPAGLHSMFLNVAVVDHQSGPSVTSMSVSNFHNAPHCSVRLGPSLVVTVSLIERESHLLMIFFLRFLASFHSD